MKIIIDIELAPFWFFEAGQVGEKFYYFTSEGKEWVDEEQQVWQQFVDYLAWFWLCHPDR